MDQTGERAMRVLTVSSTPAELFPQTESVQQAYMNSGRMSEGLAKLQSTTYLFQQAAKRNQKAAAYTEMVVSRALNAMEDEVKRGLLYSHNRLGEEVDNMKKRLDKELASTHEALGQKVQETILVVRAALEQAGSDVQEGLKDAVDMHNLCGATLQRDINSTEADYMGSIAQIVVANTWHNAVPEAVRRIREDQVTSDNSPPQYGFGSSEEADGAGLNDVTSPRTNGEVHAQ
ncbi:hypothetical protein CF319_g4707 [Tilletia indica]|nr:hypothetical protein CF319_g4707 [Tilletia indica]KAE8232847.1 hypothetical protein CF326_g2113 [Tilletia indica]